MRPRGNPTEGRVLPTDKPMRTRPFSADEIDLDRFWRRVAKPNDGAGCWLWTGATAGSYGYGQFTIRPGHPVRPHRVAYTLLVGPIPDGLVVDHLCRVRNCVNPAHLEAVSVRVNNLRGFGSGAAGARAFAEGRCLSGHDLAVVGMRRGGRGSRVCGECARQRIRRSREEAAADG